MKISSKEEKEIRSDFKILLQDIIRELAEIKKRKAILRPNEQK